MRHKANQINEMVKGIIEDAKEAKEPVIISLKEVGAIAYQNIYHTAKNLDDALDAEVMPDRKSLKIFRK